MSGCGRFDSEHEPTSARLGHAAGPLSRSRATLYRPNDSLPTLKLEGKQRVGSRAVRRYGPMPAIPARVLAIAEVIEATKARLRAEQAALNT